MNKRADMSRWAGPESTDEVACDRITMLAHDLRGFFHAIRTSLYVLRSARDDEAEFKEMLEIIGRDHDAALPKLNELIALAREQQMGQNHETNGQAHPEEDAAAEAS